jgi:hypothetical protein
MGAFEVAVALLTETRTSLDPPLRHPMSAAPIVTLPRRVRRLVARG